MNYGLYLSASGMLTNIYRQDVFANNLANVETIGFKPHIPSIAQRDAEAVEDDLSHDVAHELLERLGGGVLAGPQRLDLSVGSLNQTGSELDAALLDKNDFYVVQTTA